MAARHHGCSITPSEATNGGTTHQVDVAVVGAGFAGLYLLHRLRKAGFTGDRAGGSRRRRRHLVLEPLSRRTLRHSDHRLQLHLRSGAGDRVEMVGEIRHPAGNPALPRLRRRAAMTCGATSAFGTKVTAANWDRGHRSAGSSRPTAATAYPAAITSWPPAASPRPSRRRSMASRTSRARSISPAAGRIEERQARRQARRGDRHGLVRDPGDPVDRRAGGAADRFPAHAELCPARPQWSGTGGSCCACWKATARLTASRPAGRWQACREPQQTVGELATERRRAPRAVRAGVGRGRSRLHTDPALGRPGASTSTATRCVCRPDPREDP